MSIVTVSFEHVWLSVFLAVSWLLPFRAVCRQGSRQLSCLSLWALSFSTILRLHRHSSVSSNIPGRTPASLPSASRPNTSASRSGMVETESSRGSGSTSSASRLASFTLQDSGWRDPYREALRPSGFWPVVSLLEPLRNCPSLRMSIPADGSSSPCRLYEQSGPALVRLIDAVLTAEAIPCTLGTQTGTIFYRPNPGPNGNALTLSSRSCSLVTPLVDIVALGAS